MEYCIYLRKSRADLDAEQRGEGETLARHESALLSLATQQGLPVTQIYREVVSGDTIAARPVMQQLLSEVEQGRWAGVLVMEVERLARGDTMDQGLMAQTFKYSSTKIITPLKTYNPDNEFDEEYFEFGLFMSRREYKVINRRLQRGRLASVMEGKYVGSKPPYGYQKIKLEHEKGYTLRPVESQAEIVQLIYQWYVYGVEGVRIGPSAIATRLNGMSVQPLKGDLWSPSTVRDILSNPIYMGKIRWNWRPVQKKFVGGKRVQSRPRSHDFELINGRHSAIVDCALWESAAALARANSVPKKRPKTTVMNPLSGLIVCGECGNRLVRKPQKKAADSLACVTSGCKTVSSVLTEVETQLLNALYHWLEAYHIELKREPASAETINAKSGLLKQLSEESASTEKQKNRLHDLLESGVYDVDTFLTRSQAVGERLCELQSAIEKLREEISLQARQEKARSNIIPAVVRVLELYSEAESPAEKNALLKEVIDRVIYFKPEGGRWSKAEIKLHVYPLVHED